MSTQSMKKITKVNNTSYYVKSCIGLAFMFLFGKLPPMEPLTVVGMQILGIFIGVLFLWTTVETVWPAVMALIAFGLSDYTSVSAAIGEGMGHPVVLQLILITALCGVIGKSGSGEILSRWAVSRPFFRGKPIVFVFSFFMTFLFLSVFISSFVGIYMSWMIFYSIAELCGYEKGDKFSNLMIVGSFFASMLGGAIIPFKGWKMGILNAYVNSTGIEMINFSFFMGITFIICVIILIIYTLSMKYAFKADFSKLENFDTSKLASGNMTLTSRQKYLLYGVATIIFVSLLGTILPASSAAAIFINKGLTNAGLFAVVVAVLMAIKLSDGKPILDWKNDGSKSVSWAPVMLCVAALPIASALSSEETGVLELTNNLLSPIFAGQSSLFTLMFAIIVLAILTNIGSNVGMSMAMIPAIAPFIATTGANPALVGIAIVFTANMGLMLPGSSALSAVLFTNKEWLETKTVYKYAAFCLGLFLVVTCACFAVYNVIF